MSDAEHDEPHEGCLERACECVQADLAAAEKGRGYYSERYAVTGQQLRRAVEALRQIAAFEVDPDDGWDYSVGVMRAIAADSLDHLGGQ